MTNFTAWRLYHCPYSAKIAFIIYMESGLITSGLLREPLEMDLSEYYGDSKEFICDEFPLENAMLISCKKDLISH